jgi:hypothetical protein
MSDTETMRIERFDLPPLQQPNGKPIDQWGLRDNRCSRHHGLCRTIRLLGSHDVMIPNCRRCSRCGSTGYPIRPRSPTW